MNPDVTENITSSMSELQLQFLRHLKIQPLQTHLAAPEYLALQDSAEITGHVEQDAATSPPAALQSEPTQVMPAEQAVAHWITAQNSSPLVQDILVVLQQAGVQAQWFYQAGATEIHLTEAGLFSAPPQNWLTADSKKQLWRKLVQLLPDTIPTDTDLT